MLKLCDVHGYCNGVKILEQLHLEIQPGSRHMIMGPNGAGKSTLAKLLAGADEVTVVSGSAHFDGEDILTKTAEERAHLGIFVGFQIPPEIPGVNTLTFLYSAYNASRKAKNLPELSENDFNIHIARLAADYNFQDIHQFLSRNVNEGFSGGEKKKNEIWQMLVLAPRFVLLDEPDSGLDVDALRFVCKTIEKFQENHPESALCLVTHNPKLGRVLIPDYVHILLDGRIVHTGGPSLMEALEQFSYAEVLSQRI